MPEITTLDEIGCSSCISSTHEKADDETLVKPMTPPSSPNATYSIYFRPLVESDREEIKKLHEELFPVQYTDQFYDLVVKNLGMDEKPLFSSIAFAHVEDEERSSSLSIDYSAWYDLANHIGFQLDTKDIRYRWKIKERVTKMMTKTTTSDLLSYSCCSQVIQCDTMIGCVVGTFMDTACIPEDIVEQLVYYPERYTKMFYIMTLGSSAKFRGRGLGTKLIQDCIRLVEQVECCGVIYLHVITYNDTAIRLYEKLGFYRIDRIKDYYTIDDKKHDCYLYAKFTNGKISDVVSYLFSSTNKIYYTTFYKII